MKQSQFTACYDTATKCNIETSEFFNCAGFFWLGLSPKQMHKMCELLSLQGCPTVERNGAAWFVLANGTQIKNV